MLLSCVRGIIEFLLPCSVGVHGIKGTSGVWEKANGSVFGVRAAANNLFQDWKEAQTQVRVVEHKEKQRIKSGKN